jgi:hypothetical protein
LYEDICAQCSSSWFLRFEGVKGKRGVKKKRTMPRPRPRPRQDKIKKATQGKARQQTANCTRDKHRDERGQARRAQDKARKDKTGQDKTRQDNTTQHNTTQNNTK